MKWLCCQIGWREHYAVPRALAQAGELAGLATDVWAPPQTLWSRIAAKRFEARYHSDLSDSPVRSWNASMLAFESWCRLSGVAGWERVERRNALFQRKASAWLEQGEIGADTVFAYSYAARSLFEVARAQGLRTVLGQIDPGPVEEQLLGELYSNVRQPAGGWQPASADYWQSWRRECELADRIIVNSDWSRKSLERAGICTDKIRVVPLAYEPPSEAQKFVRQYPRRFTAERPLCVLFLGQVIARKGIRECLEAWARLKDEPVELWIAGGNPGEIVETPQSNIHWLGFISRDEAIRRFQTADVFLFPSRSEGFGLTQLEAQAWKLPIISSPFCAEVVKQGRNGLVLDRVNAGEIEKAIRLLLEKPAMLEEMSRHSVTMEEYSLGALARNLNLVVTAVEQRREEQLVQY